MMQSRYPLKLGGRLCLSATSVAVKSSRMMRSLLSNRDCSKWTVYLVINVVSEMSVLVGFMGRNWRICETDTINRLLILSFMVLVRLMIDIHAAIRSVVFSYTF